MIHILLALAAGAAPVVTGDADVAKVRAAELEALSPIEANVGDITTLGAAQVAFDTANARACDGAQKRLVALQPEADGATPVYLLSISPQEDRLYPGGHYRVLIDSSGNARDVYDFGGGCDPIGWNLEDPELDVAVAYFQRPAGLTAPTEIDYWLSSRTPLFIGMVSAPYVWPMAGGEAGEAVEADGGMMSGTVE